MEKNKLFSDEKIEKIKKMRKVFLQVAVWTLIAAFALGAILILSWSWDVFYVKIIGTLLVISLVFFVSVNNFIRMEKGNKTIQALAAVGFVSNVIWALFAISLIWQVVPFFWEEETISRYGYSVIQHHMTFWSMIMALSGYTAAGCFWISNVLAIKETVKVVKPLKITSVVCSVYCWTYAAIVTLTEFDYSDAMMGRLGLLAGLASFAFQVTALAALIISLTNKKKLVEGGAAKDHISKTEVELRAEIEEKVRREMIEKELRERMEKEQPVKEGGMLFGDKNDKEEPKGEVKIEESNTIIEDTFDNKE